eukprot:1028071_1
MASVSTSSSTEYNNSFKWTISKQTLLHILLSNQREQFVSNNFVIGKITWQLIGYPTYDTGTFSIYLRPFNIPPGWDQIIVSANLFCEETLCGDASIFTYTKHQLYRAQHWSPGCLSINEIKTLDQLIISVNVQILQIIAVPQFTSSSPILIYQHKSSLSPGNEPTLKDQTFKWVIDDALLKEMKNCLYGKCFISTADVHDLFCLKIFPNGYQQQGQVHLEVQWSGIPIEANNALLKWTLSIPEADINCNGIHRFEFDLSAAHWGSKILSTEQLKECESLAIYCKISPVKGDLHRTASQAPTLYQSRSANVVLAPTVHPPLMDARVLPVLQQFWNNMSNLWEEMRRMRQSVAQNYTYNQQCIAQVSRELLVLKQQQHEMIKHIQYERMQKVQADVVGDVQSFKQNGYNEMDAPCDLTEDHLFLIGVDETDHRKRNMERTRCSTCTSSSGKSTNRSAGKSPMSPISHDSPASISESRKRAKINKILRLQSSSYDDGFTDEEELKKWLSLVVKLPQYFEILLANGYDDLEAVAEVTFDELERIGMNKMGHRKKMMKCAARLRGDQDVTAITKPLNVEERERLHNTIWSEGGLECM